jgi:hypothetical protein
LAGASETELVGIDCATRPERIGLAFATLPGERCQLVHAGLGSERDD